MRIPLLFLLLAWALPTPAVAQTSFTYQDWAAVWFPFGGTDAEPASDPDGDKIPNVSEFAFGTSPVLFNAEPAIIPTGSYNYSFSLELHYSLSAFPTNLIVMPQVTEDLKSGKWRADQIRTYSSPDYLRPDFLDVTAIDYPNGVPLQRFMRLLIALDSDSDGMSDDWETSHGLSPYYDGDGNTDYDGDGDSAWREFLQGSDPEDGDSNSMQFRAPRAPRMVKIIEATQFQVLWEDASDNEAEFRIYGPSGMLGTVPRDGTQFDLPPTYTQGTPISVSAANPLGESAHMQATDLSASGGRRTSVGDVEIHSLLSTPRDLKILRVNTTTVKVTWKFVQGQMPATYLNGLSVRIVRQQEGEEWAIIHEAAFPLLPGESLGEFMDAAPIGKTWRYSAMTFYNGTSDSGNGVPRTDQSVGSDAAEILVDDYVKSLFGLKIFRGYNGDPSMASLGKQLNGDPTKLDIHSETARSFDGRNPSFVEINLNQTDPVPAIFSSSIDPFQGKRYFTDSDKDTTLAYDGFVVRGHEFLLEANQKAVLANPIDTLLRMDTAPMRVGTPGLAERARGAGRIEYDLPSGSIHNPNVFVKSDRDDRGFDSVTFPACQILVGDPLGVDPKRRLFFEATCPTSSPFNFSQHGPFEKELLTPTLVEVVATGPEDTGELILDPFSPGVDEGRKVLIHTLPLKVRTLTTHKVSYSDTFPNSSGQLQTFRWEGPEPLDAAALTSYFREIFYDQAGVSISVTRGADIELNSSDLPAPLLFSEGKPIFTGPDIHQQAALWARSYQITEPDLVLFFVPSLGYNVAGQAFQLNSRGALIAPDATENTCAHELGHCFGLYHACNDLSRSPLSKLPDKSGRRLMDGAGSAGRILRYNESRQVNNGWTVLGALYPGHIFP